MYESTSTGNNFDGEAIGGSVLDGQFIAEGQIHEATSEGGQWHDLSYDGQIIGRVHHNADGSFTGEIFEGQPYELKTIGPSFSIVRKDGGHLPEHPSVATRFARMVPAEPEPINKVAIARDAE